MDDQARMKEMSRQEIVDNVRKSIDYIKKEPCYSCSSYVEHKCSCGVAEPEQCWIYRELKDRLSVIHNLPDFDTLLNVELQEFGESICRIVDNKMNLYGKHTVSLIDTHMEYPNNQADVFVIVLDCDGHTLTGKYGVDMAILDKDDLAIAIAHEMSTHFLANLKREQEGY